MIRIDDQPLDSTTSKELARLQKRVDKELTFASRADRAQRLWKSKGGKKGKEAFEKIKEELLQLTVFKEICNYCEQSEANDIEHIDPKSFFPQRCFSWRNYLLACKQCNSGFKLDKCNVLDGNSDLIQVKRGLEPPHDSVAFINPRIEDPSQLMLLNLESFKFEIMPDLSKRDIHRVQSTLDILELNKRDLLISARKSAVDHYFLMLQNLIRILKCRTRTQLANLLSPNDNLFDMSKKLSQLKVEIKEAKRLYISTYQHPSVWHAIKIVGSKTSSKWQRIFNEIPEAIDW